MATILIVDDRTTNRDVLVTVLGYRHHRLLEASDGREALALAQAELPDLIISDILMPTMDGFEFVRLLRADPTIGATPVIFSTAHYLDREAAALAQAVGVPHILHKPTEPELVLAMVDSVIGTATKTAASSTDLAFDHEHLRLLTDVLASKTNLLRGVTGKLDALIELTISLSAERDPSTLLAKTCSSARQLFAARYAVAGMIDARGQIEAPIVSSGMDNATATQLSLISSHSLIKAVLEDRKPRRISARSATLVTEGADAPLLPGHPQIDSLLAVPIASAKSLFGWLCLSGKVGFDEFTEDDNALAGHLAGLIGAIFESRAAERALRQQADALERAVATALDSRRRLEGVVESAMDALITIDARQRIVLFNPAAERMFGATAADAVGGPLERFIPRRFRTGHAAHIRGFKETGVTTRKMGALGVVSGLRANGEEFPIEASISQVKVGGKNLATVILRDITERRANEEARFLLAREVDHRAKNALAVVQALVSLTRAATTDDFIAAVQGRVSTLARAHSSLAQNRWEGANLAQIIAGETEAFQGPDQKIRINGPSIVLKPDAVQSVSLLIHELATNAVKYGALSVEAGRVEFEWRTLPGGDLELRWSESHGPTVCPPSSEGFGSRLLRQVTTHQLGGSLDIGWPAEGLRFVATLPSRIFDCAPDARATAAAESDEDDVAQRGRLLVVEDEVLISMELCKGLSSLGWKIVGPVASIEEVLSLLEGTPRPDAAVLDVNVGGKSIYPVADWLQSNDVPFVFCTGYDRLDDRKVYPSVPLLQKPVNINQLDRRLRRARAPSPSDGRRTGGARRKSANI